MSPSATEVEVLVGVNAAGERDVEGNPEMDGLSPEGSVFIRGILRRVDMMP